MKLITLASATRSDAVTAASKPWPGPSNSATDRRACRPPASRQASHRPRPPRPHNIRRNPPAHSSLLFPTSILRFISRHASWMSTPIRDGSEGSPAFVRGGGGGALPCKSGRAVPSRSRTMLPSRRVPVLRKIPVCPPKMPGSRADVATGGGTAAGVTGSPPDQASPELPRPLSRLAPMLPILPEPPVPTRSGD